MKTEYEQFSDGIEITARRIARILHAATIDCMQTVLSVFRDTVASEALDAFEKTAKSIETVISDLSDDSKSNKRYNQVMAWLLSEVDGDQNEPWKGFDVRAWRRREEGERE